MAENLLTVEEARAAILERTAVLPAEERDIDDALGRVLAEVVTAPEDVPPFTNSAMDGFAVRAGDVAGASPEGPVELRVLADLPAGTAARVRVAPGTAARIMTGARMPEGADAVVPVEHTAMAAGTVWVRRAVRAGGNVRRAGEDVRAGETVLAPGAVLRPAELGLLAAVGRARVRVVRAPVVAVVTTGDELVAAGETRSEGQIRDVNIHSLCGQVWMAGATPVPFPRVRDTREAVQDALVQAWGCADVVVTNGGVSVGAWDHVKAVLEELGAQCLFWGVRQKPGKPMAFWEWNGKPVLGLPGNPVSCMICFEEYVRPALRRMMGHALLHRPVRTAVLVEGFDKAEGDLRTHFLRVVARQEGDRLVARATGPQGSGILSSMVRANALAVVPGESRGVAPGEEVLLHMTELPEDH
ncbi:MAG TPA: molybdopterin molybdotransferase MoeA [Thermoanaerobaculaceae bacterium]|nr:molybdopterin molybdotransferase MoeA [Thermoanaerobaculaceae bacterium]HRS16500.1 molybdopterin molybdotransferase MoeA [Thermoanaerobaculaceae bacterium]